MATSKITTFTDNDKDSTDDDDKDDSTFSQINPMFTSSADEDEDIDELDNPEQVRVFHNESQGFNMPNFEMPNLKLSSISSKIPKAPQNLAQSIVYTIIATAAAVVPLIPIVGGKNKNKTKNIYKIIYNG